MRSALIVFLVCCGAIGCRHCNQQHIRTSSTMSAATAPTSAPAEPLVTMTVRTVADPPVAEIIIRTNGHMPAIQGANFLTIDAGSEDGIRQYDRFDLRVNGEFAGMATMADVTKHHTMCRLQIWKIPKTASDFRVEITRSRSIQPND